MIQGRWAKPTLVGDSVTLRPMTVDDAPALWAGLEDAEGRDLTATTATFTYEQIVEWCATRADQDERLDLTIVERASGEVAGEAVLNEYDGVANAANFRIALAGPRFYGRGLGTEATRLIVEHGLGPVGLDAVTLGVLARNPRARAAYVKAGFVETGEYDEDGERWVEMTRRRPELH